MDSKPNPTDVAAVMSGAAFSANFPRAPQLLFFLGDEETIFWMILLSLDIRCVFCDDILVFFTVRVKLRDVFNGWCITVLSEFRGHVVQMVDVFCDVGGRSEQEW